MPMGQERASGLSISGLPGRPLAVLTEGLARKYLLSSKPLVLVLGAALIAAISVLDYITGFEFDLEVLFLAPVCLVTWLAGRNSGILLAVFAGAAWIGNDQLTSHILPHAFLMFPHTFLHYWKAAILLATWVAIAMLVDKLKLALARADERFATVLSGMHQAVYVFDPENGELLFMNQRCRDLFGAGGPLVNSRQIESQLQPAPDGSGRGDEYADLAREHWYRIRRRQLRWIDGRMMELRVAAEVTDRRLAEELSRRQQEQLQLTSHLLTMGGLASTLAHEINQPLAAIANYNMGCVRRLRAGDCDPKELLEAMEKAGAQAERAGRIIHRVRELVRKRKAEPVPCDVNGVISDIARLLEVDAEKNAVRIRLELGSGLPAVPADRIMLEQAILNLARNAIDSMRQSPPGERELTLRSRLEAEGRTVAIEVVDSGSGIPEAMVGSAFEPFFTTKPEGMGMGLSICRSIVEMHRGRLWATRNEGRGSTFHLTLPGSEA